MAIVSFNPNNNPALKPDVLLMGADLNSQHEIKTTNFTFRHHWQLIQMLELF